MLLILKDGNGVHTVVHIIDGVHQCMNLGTESTTQESVFIDNRVNDSNRIR